MTESEQILIAKVRCDTVQAAVSQLLSAVFGGEHKFVLVIAPSEDPNVAGCIVGDVDSEEHAEALLRSALGRNKNDNALDLGESQTKQ